MRATLILIALALVTLSACITPRTAEVKLYQDADEMLALGRYEEALGVHREFIANNPESDAMDGAYMRMAQIYLLTMDPTGRWPGWYGANRVTARDTLLGLIRRKPDTRFHAEVTLWVRLLDSAIGLQAEADSLAAVIGEERALHAATAGEAASVRSEKERLAANVRSVRADNRRLARENDQLRRQAQLVQEELARVREDAARMRRMIMDLESETSR